MELLFGQSDSTPVMPTRRVCCDRDTAFDAIRFVTRKSMLGDTLRGEPRTDRALPRRSSVASSGRMALVKLQDR